MNIDQSNAIKTELERLHENCLYSAQAYFEAAKQAELWGRLLVFIPACVSTVCGVMTSVDSWKFWGAMGAVCGAIAATGSFLGSTKRATDFLSSARAYTVLRHKIKLALNLLSIDQDFVDAQAQVTEFSNEYTQIVASDFPVPNRSFNLASRRISQGAAS